MSTSYSAVLVVGFLVPTEVFMAGQKAEVPELPQRGWSCRVPVLGSFADASIEEVSGGQETRVRLDTGALKELTKKEREAIRIEQPESLWRLPDGSTTENHFALIEAWAEQLGCSIEPLIGADDLWPSLLMIELGNELADQTKLANTDEEHGLGGALHNCDGGTCSIEYAVAALPQLILLRERLVAAGFHLPRHPAIHAVQTAG